MSKRQRVQKVEQITETMYRFRLKKKAVKFAKKCTIRNYVLEGDDQRYWVGLPAQTDALAHLGYQYA